MDRRVIVTVTGWSKERRTRAGLSAPAEGSDGGRANPRGEAATLEEPEGARRAWFAVVALLVGTACAHDHPRVAVAREDRATAIVRRWSRNEATAEEVAELTGQFERLPAPLLVEAMQAAETVGQPRRVDDAFRCSNDASADSPLECGINTGGDQFHGNVQAGFVCGYVIGGRRCEATMLSCRELGTGTEGTSCDGHDVCFTAEPGGVSVRSARGVRLVRAERLPDIPNLLRCPSARR